MLLFPWTRIASYIRIDARPAARARARASTRKTKSKNSTFRKPRRGCGGPQELKLRLYNQSSATGSHALLWTEDAHSQTLNRCPAPHRALAPANIVTLRSPVGKHVVLVAAQRTT